MVSSRSVVTVTRRSTCPRAPASHDRFLSSLSFPPRLLTYDLETIIKEQKGTDRMKGWKRPVSFICLSIPFVFMNVTETRAASCRFLTRYPPPSSADRDRSLRSRGGWVGG